MTEDSLRENVKREVSVAFAKEAQPLWLRITKYVVILGGGVTFYLYAGWIAVVSWLLFFVLAGLSLHAVYRHKTRGWTQPWGGWPHHNK